ncbi:DUF7511 domain-containing protein [Halorarius litoreus]|uniref:DUF7511 domain-containing protein n=1 Tax=Halorarius litoreus TaxID=2962676 RepID=UPI0020CCA10C|nr:hypothetical protein [Halorarius litoreus]
MAAADHSDLPVSPADTYELSATLHRTDDGTVLCTIYPTDAEPDAQQTTWVCAKEGFFVSLDAIR